MMITLLLLWNYCIRQKYSVFIVFEKPFLWDLLYIIKMFYNKYNGQLKIIKSHMLGLEFVVNLQIATKSLPEQSYHEKKHCYQWSVFFLSKPETDVYFFIELSTLTWKHATTTIIAHKITLNWYIKSSQSTTNTNIHL